MDEFKKGDILKYNFYSDPGHGWLRVPKAKLKELGIADKISPFSYQRGNWVYLEEDCDLGTFIRALGDTHRKIKEVTSKNPSKIRTYEAYRYESI